VTRFVCGENRPRCCPTLFLTKIFFNYYREKSSPNAYATFVIKKKLPEVNNHPLGEN
jgi:hypothetical protein